MNPTLPVPETRAPAQPGTAPQRVSALVSGAVDQVENWLTPVFDLAIRVFVSWQFLKSGWLKISQWDSTLALFENEYKVPVLSPHLAAIMGTGGELVLPILLILGLAGRFGAAGLFVVNAMAVISYPDLSELGYKDHVLWGALLLVSVFHGPGRLSVDHWLKTRLGSIGRAPHGDKR